MAFGFRKSKKIGGVRLNMSKRGVGISGGTRHARVSTNTRGQKRGSLSGDYVLDEPKRIRQDR